MRFMCEKCRGIVHVDDKLAGGRVKCGHCGEVVTVPRTNTSPGAIIGDFVIEREINRGGMGIVYLAQQMSLEREVALKILLQKYASDTEFVTQFIREARSAAKLNHPNIVQAYAVGEENGTFYFAMEFIDGETMKDVLKREQVIPVKRAAAVIKDIAEALDFAWREQRIVHHDIKPDNIMVTSSGRAKLADLGLAKVAGDIESENDEDEVLGTPQYISPEQLTGSPTDVRSDLYSLGATFYHFVTGRFPYVGPNPNAIAKQHLDGTLIPPNQINKEIPRKISDIICRMMEKDPKQRYQSADVVARELGRFIEENSTHTELLALRSLRERGIAGAKAVKAKKKLILGIAVAVGVLVLGAGILMIFPFQTGKALSRVGIQVHGIDGAPAVSNSGSPQTTPAVPAPKTARAEYLAKVKQLMADFQKAPQDESGFLNRCDEFLNGPLNPPVCDEETNAAASLMELYSRIDERLRVIPMRREARRRHLAEIEKRRADERKRAEDEAKRRAEELRAQRERQRLLDEQRRREDEERRKANERAVKYCADLDEWMNKLSVAFIRSAQAGNDGDFNREAADLKKAAALPSNPTPLENSKNREALNYLGQLQSELVKTIQVSRLFLTKGSALSSFLFDPGREDMVRVVGPGAKFGELLVKSSFKGNTYPVSMNDEAFRKQFSRLVEKRLKLNDVEFYYQLAAANFSPELAGQAPSGFWKSNYSLFLKNYLRGVWFHSNEATRQELTKRYGTLAEFRQIAR